MKPKVRMTIEEFVKLNTIEQEVKENRFDRLITRISKFLFDYKISIFRS
jgi:hypothetical protein